MTERPASPASSSARPARLLDAAGRRTRSLLATSLENAFKYLRRWWPGRVPSKTEAKSDLDRVLGEMGLSHDELVPYLRGHREGSRLRERMMARLGIARGGIDPSLEREIERACALCPAKARCRRWLQYGWFEGHREFCPNAARFDLSRWRRSPKP
jgi:hypothetical protein